MKKQKIINGIDINRLAEIIDVIEKSPDLARFQFRAKNTWMNGGHSRSVIKSFYGGKQEDNTRSEPFILENDQPLIMLGKDKGASPVEYILNALAGCITNSIVYHATLKGIRINDIESELEGNIDLRNLFMKNNEIDNPEDNIKVKIRITGNELQENEKSFLCELGKKTSPVYKVITNAIPVELVVENELDPD
ncbi:MAG: OsmC family protein [Ignavibacteriaceae bacterium]|jgi:uncharacterized OsmC-like protein